MMAASKGNATWGQVMARIFLAAVIAFGIMAPSAPALAALQAGDAPSTAAATQAASSVDDILAGMTLDEKVSQMIVPAFRTWNDKNVTSLDDAPELAEALKRHQYGGVILYGANIAASGQVTRLVSALQKNNAAIEGASTHIPYLTCVDGEGGVVWRLATGTRMTGSMAIGATGASAKENALATGRVIGEEIAAAGFNVDFAPDIDVNSNPANPVIGTRSFSDDPQTVAELGTAFASGLAESGVIATYKHFPGHGDTGTDSHLDVSSVTKTQDELEACELVPFRNAIANDADLVMTAHVTLPNVDDEATFADGTKGYFPATMSHKAITEILRGEMGYDGVVITDALEMDALYKAQLVEGGGNTEAERKASAEYGANLAVKVIEAGVDILLMPTDLINANAARYYDDYIAALAKKAQEDSGFAARIDQSVARVLKMKDKYGILSADTSGDDVEEKAKAAEQAIGSAAHRAIESDIARQAVTLLKNKGCTLPLSGHDGNIVIFARDSDHVKTVEYAIRQMQADGLIVSNACVTNLESGKTTGSSSSPAHFTIGFYRDYPSGSSPVVHYTDEMKKAVKAADAVIAFSVNYNLAALQPASDQYQAVTQIMADAHAAGAQFALLSSNLPYDVARYQNADAIMCCYMSAGLDSDPTDSAGGLQAYDANVVRALFAMFGAPCQGKLPVSVPAIAVADDGTVDYSKTETLYPRGFGIAANPMGVSASLALSYKPAAQSADNPLKATGAQGGVSYAKIGGDARISIDKTSGKVSLAKGMPVGTYDVTVVVKAAGSNTCDPAAITENLKVRVAKAANTLSVKAKKSTFKASSKKRTAFAASKVFKVTKNTSSGKLAYKLVSVPKAANGKIAVSKTGKLTAKKGLKKGKTYKVKVQVASAATASYAAAKTTVSFKVKAG